jgi:hypothetical protein
MFNAQGSAPRKEPTVSRAHVIQSPPLLRPGFSACPLAASSKIISHLSRVASDGLFVPN